MAYLEISGLNRFFVSEYFRTRKISPEASCLMFVSIASSSANTSGRYRGEDDGSEYHLVSIASSSANTPGHGGYDHYAGVSHVSIASSSANTPGLDYRAGNTDRSIVSIASSSANTPGQKWRDAPRAMLQQRLNRFFVSEYSRTDRKSVV